MGTAGKPPAGLLAAFPLPPPAQEMSQQLAERKRGSLPHWRSLKAAAPPPVLELGDLL